ncbi:MAG: hypothetical protein ACRDS1_08160 [Pseudonocardiaceae bacterium]
MARTLNGAAAAAGSVAKAVLGEIQIVLLLPWLGSLLLLGMILHGPLRWPASD